MLTYKKITTTGGENLLRCGHSANVYKNKMFVFGGRLENKPVKSTNELWSLNLGNYPLTDSSSIICGIETFHWELCETIGDLPGKPKETFPL